ncbi:hypothetical protein [Tateyamaria omphalii]|uniref:hypothetical protein n=1 Tax=Tateyamaria omphalii TaxID=299262 RepID=UPI0012F7B36A|nr:hypothetical protein [Tateyamaria omphalii]
MQDTLTHLPEWAIILTVVLFASGGIYFTKSHDKGWSIEFGGLARLIEAWRKRRR